MSVATMGPWFWPGDTDAPRQRTLTPVTIDNAKARAKIHALTEGGRLQLEVLPSGNKPWRYKDHRNGSPVPPCAAPCLTRWGNRRVRAFAAAAA
jgi:hypothetical protein